VPQELETARSAANGVGRPRQSTTKPYEQASQQKANKGARRQVLSEAGSHDEHDSNATEEQNSSDHEFPGLTALLDVACWPHCPVRLTVRVSGGAVNDSTTR